MYLKLLIVTRSLYLAKNKNGVSFNSMILSSSSFRNKFNIETSDTQVKSHSLKLLHMSHSLSPFVELHNGISFPPVFLIKSLAALKHSELKTLDALSTLT